jgi:hypothetical protein
VDPRHNKKFAKQRKQKQRGIYSADIGCYEQGRNIEFPEATNTREAWEMAHDYLEEHEEEFKKYTPSPYVSQIRFVKGDRSSILWDFMQIYPPEDKE